jgi:hypothetical protein
MQIAALCHTEMVGELVVLWVVVSSVVELVLEHLPDETFWVEVLDELIAKFQRLEERCSWLEQPGTRIYNLLLGPPLSQARLADLLDEATRQLGSELAAWWEADAELEALLPLTVRVQDLVLDNANGSSSLAAFVSTVVELLEG